MKYLLVIPDGCADEPLIDLEDQTPLSVASTPNLDSLAEMGRLGTALTAPPGIAPTDDVTLMSVLGYDPREHLTGFAPLEAIGMGLDAPDDVWLIRISLITADRGELSDHQGGTVNTAETTRLLGDLHDAMCVQRPELAKEWRFMPGKAHRAILVDVSGRSYAESVMHPAAMLLDQSLHRARPSGEHQKLLRDLIVTSESVFLEHDVNETRIEIGEPPITHAWPWGAGPAAVRDIFTPFADSYGGLRGVMVTANDLAAGLATAIGWDVARLKDDTNPTEIVRQARKALAKFDIICVYLTEADRLSHIGDAIAKVECLANLDQLVVGPLKDAVASYNEWRMLVMPTHMTSSATGRHERTAVPCVMAGELLMSVVKGPFTEQDADDADLHIAVGSELMEYFLFGSGIGRRDDS